MINGIIEENTIKIKIMKEVKEFLISICEMLLFKTTDPIDILFGVIGWIGVLIILINL